MGHARRAIEHAKSARDLAGGAPTFRWDFAITYKTLGDAQVGAGQLKEAVQSYEEAIKVDPKWPDLLDRLAWLLATSWDDSIRDGKRAVELAKRACELAEWKDPSLLDTLAASHAEAGQFADAVTRQKKALEHPEALPKGDVEGYKARLKLYETGKPLRQTKPEPKPEAKPAQPPK